MASFRVLDQAPQYLLPSGKVNAGGKLFFYTTNLTTPKSTWANEAKTVLNPNPVVMDAAGRTLTDVWGDGEYGVVMTDALGVPLWTRNNVKATGSGASTTLPALGVGQFITSNGTNLVATNILQVPDPTGFAGNQLYSDGALAYWAPPATPPAQTNRTVTIGAGLYKFGDGSGSNFLVEQFGTGTAPPSSTLDAHGRLHLTSATVTFPTAYAILDSVIVMPTGGAVNTVGFFAIPNVTSQSPTGFTVQFQMNDDDSESRLDITSTVNFMWIAKGRTTT